MKCTLHGAWLAVAAVAAVCLAFSTTASAKNQKPRRQPDVVWYQYAAQFTCGQNSGGADRAVPSLYATAVHVHNPHPGEVILRKHLALTYPPEAQAAGEVSSVLHESLDRRSALQVDCGEILSEEFEFENPPATDYVQGFLVIESRRSLDVAATYTASAVGSEVSVDAEPIPERTIVRPYEPEVFVVCHQPPGNVENAHEIEIDEDAWPAHREHGDFLGPCDGPAAAN